jgi:hypothetical protein
MSDELVDFEYSIGRDRDEPLRISEMYLTSNSTPPARRLWWRRFLDRFTRDGEARDE